jgi:hypothetical protein
MQFKTFRAVAAPGPMETTTTTDVIIDEKDLAAMALDQQEQQKEQRHRNLFFWWGSRESTMSVLSVYMSDVSLSSSSSSSLSCSFFPLPIFTLFFVFGLILVCLF